VAVHQAKLVHRVHLELHHQTLHLERLERLDKLVHREHQVQHHRTLHLELLEVEEHQVKLVLLVLLVLILLALHLEHLVQMDLH
jgi:hypothetical protein